MKQIALFGGSYNPIHLGHLALAQATLDQQLAEEVWLMVSPHNPLKRQQDLLDESERFRLVQMAIADRPGLKASDFEFSLPRPSYTWQTLEALQEAYPDCRFSLLIGADNWAHFHQWARWEQLLQQHDIIVYPRRGHLLAPPFPPRVKRLEVPYYDLSSTHIRQQVAEGKDISQAVPPSILHDCLRLYARP